MVTVSTGGCLSKPVCSNRMALYWNIWELKWPFQISRPLKTQIMKQKGDQTAAEQLKENVWILKIIVSKHSFVKRKRDERCCLWTMANKMMAFCFLKSKLLVNPSQRSFLKPLADVKTSYLLECDGQISHHYIFIGMCLLLLETHRNNTSESLILDLYLIKRL